MLQHSTWIFFKNEGPAEFGCRGWKEDSRLTGQMMDPLIHLTWGQLDIECLLGWSWSSNTLTPDAKSQLIGKDPDAGKHWGQEEKGATEDEMIGWHHWLNGHGFEQILGDSGGQGSLVCCSHWDRKETDMNNWTTTNLLDARYCIESWDIGRAKTCRILLRGAGI